MEYRILGPLAVLRDGQTLVLGGLRQRAVLAVLLLAGDRAVEVDRLIEQVWGEGAPPKPLASLRAYVTNLRRILGGDGVLVREGTGYRLDTAIDVVDVREFARLTAAGRRLLDLGDASGAKSAFDEALARWRGIPLADFRNLNFAMPEVSSARHHACRRRRVAFRGGAPTGGQRRTHRRRRVRGREQSHAGKALVATDVGDASVGSAYRCTTGLRATAMHRDLTDAQALLVRAETIAAATGERVWDAQLSARRLRLAARQRTEHRRPPAEQEAKP